MTHPLHLVQEQQKLFFKGFCCYVSITKTILIAGITYGGLLRHQVPCQILYIISFHLKRWFSDFFYAHVLRQCMYFVPFRKIAHTPEHPSHFNKSFFYRERVRASEPGTSECELWLLHEFFKWNLACSVVSETLYSHPCNENASLPQNSSEDDIRHHVWVNACTRLSTKHREMHESWVVPYSRQDRHQIVSCALTLLMNSIL